MKAKNISISGICQGFLSAVCWVGLSVRLQQVGIRHAWVSLENAPIIWVHPWSHINYYLHAWSSRTSEYLVQWVGVSCKVLMFRLTDWQGDLSSDVVQKQPKLFLAHPKLCDRSTRLRPQFWTWPNSYPVEERGFCRLQPFTPQTVAGSIMYSNS